MVWINRKSLRKKGIVLSLAGFDPTGSAGILADVKVFSLFGLKGAGIPTTLTLQNTTIFEKWKAVDSNYLKRALELIFSDLPILGIKIGMIGTLENIKIIGEILKKERNKISWIVLDPVLRASLDFPLFSSSTFLNSLKSEIFPYVDIITPNLKEAEILTQKQIKEKSHLFDLAKELLSYKMKAVIIKGWETKFFLWDFFYSLEGDFVFLKNKKIQGTFHGTGCVFSSVLLSYLVKGYEPISAFKKAKNWVYLNLKKVSKEKIGGKIWLFL